MNKDHQTIEKIEKPSEFQDRCTSAAAGGPEPASTLLQSLGSKSIVLVGIMGSGKTSVGKRLAAKLGLDFTDADSEIEAAAGMSVADIFSQHGEESFRRGEQRVIERLLHERPRILATGGGAFMNAKTRQIISETAVSVWLHADHAVLMRRVRRRTHRPLLQTSDPDAVMRQLMDERYPTYATADLTVTSGDGPHDSVVHAIIGELNKYFDVSAGTSSSSQSSVRVELAERAYDIVIGPNLILNAGAHINKIAAGRKCAIVTDTNVASLYLEPLKKSLADFDLPHTEIIVEPGEQSKSLQCFSNVCVQILEQRLERQDVVIALGGGVIGDLSGFVAATIRRGMQLVQIPTTLLAQVDSSVGGKTAVNTKFGKNLIGAFYQPNLVLADTEALASLPAREFRGGYAEVIKYGLINNADFFYWLEKNWHGLFANEWPLADAIRTSCKSKSEIVSRDETEQGERALLNLGHTFAHALEVLCDYDSAIINHGEAVAIGLCCAARFSVQLRYLDPDSARRIASHVSAVGLPSRINDLGNAGSFTAESLLDAMYQDKKVTRGKLNFILLNAVGKAFIAKAVDEAQVQVFLQQELSPE